MGGGIFRRFAGWCGSAALAWLLTVNVAVWLLTAVVSLLPAGCPLTEATLERALALPSGFGDWAWRPWTLLSYMVTQFSLLHLLFNMLWLFWFGRLSLTLSDSRGLAGGYIGGGGGRARARRSRGRSPGWSPPRSRSRGTQYTPADG